MTQNRETTHDDNQKAVVTLPGTVEKIIPSLDPSQPDKAQIAVEGAEPLYKELRIENTLEKDNGEQVSLKPGAEVQVTIAADPEATTPQDQNPPPTGGPSRKQPPSAGV
ncbi:MAG TPA: hypothetical protein VN982_03065 [Candidatus Dormibacteraeota bacterium]|nr:hypothetical protein [Candidatus Dormibacteraeota bacterium]